ncbi:MAG TPA: response regulator transcription factor [Membranihabitans sp.]|nr:response regulator transcription factor [Membranihabitans sp.]
MYEIRVLVVEDDPLIAEDIREFLTNVDYNVVGVEHHKEGALKSLKNNLPDVVLLDINLDNAMDGFEIARHINEIYQIPFLYLTSYSGKSVVDQAKQTKPMGYIVKPFEERELFASIEVAMYNHSQRSNPQYMSFEALNKKLLTKLTSKEYEILLDIYEGKPNKQIAQKHFISINTVKTHIQNLYTKLSTNSRTSTIARMRELYQ